MDKAMVLRNGNEYQVTGEYKDQLQCLRGFLVSASEAFDLTPEELLSYALMTEEELPSKEIRRVDVVFHFAPGNTLVKTLNGIQQKGVCKVLNLRIDGDELQCVDDFTLKQALGRA